MTRRLGAHELSIDFDSVTVNGKRYSVEATTIGKESRQGVGANERTGKFVGGGAILGTLLGAIAGGGKGAAIGALAGAGAGAGAAANRCTLQSGAGRRRRRRWWWVQVWSSRQRAGQCVALRLLCPPWWSICYK